MTNEEKLYEMVGQVRNLQIEIRKTREELKQELWQHMIRDERGYVYFPRTGTHNDKVEDLIGILETGMSGGWSGWLKKYEKNYETFCDGINKLRNGEEP